MEMNSVEEKSMSDMIENYLKQILGDDEQIEIRRAEIADHFDVVPSQINYVIKTRFTLQNGYLVQSKRGGGGYIRIERVNLRDDDSGLEMVLKVVGDSISEKDAFRIVKTLYEEGMISRREGDLMLVALSKETLSDLDKREQNKVRAKILTAYLNRLRYES